MTAIQYAIARKAIQFTTRLEAGERLNEEETAWAQGVIRQTLEYIEQEQQQVLEAPRLYQALVRCTAEYREQPEGMPETLRLYKALARCTSREKLCRVIQTSRRRNPFTPEVPSQENS